MLVLSRKQNERVHIGENVVITVVRIAGGGVRLGIEAPAEVSIKRDELLDTSGGIAFQDRTQTVSKRTLSCVGSKFWSSNVTAK